MKITLHCTDCVYAEFEQNEQTGRWRGTCKRGYRLTNPNEFHGADRFFVDDPDMLVPTIDPRGHEYLRTKDICDSYVHISDLDKGAPGRGGIFRFFKNRLQADREKKELEEQSQAEAALKAAAIEAKAQAAPDAGAQAAADADGHQPAASPATDAPAAASNKSDN